MQAQAEARETEARGRAELDAAVAAYEEQLDALQRAADERQAAAETARRAVEQWQKRCGSGQPRVAPVMGFPSDKVHDAPLTAPCIATASHE